VSTLLAAWNINFCNRAASGPLQRFTGKKQVETPAASRRFKTAQTAASIQPAVQDNISSGFASEEIDT